MLALRVIVYFLLMLGSAERALACLSSPRSMQGSIRIGVDWVNSKCAGNRGADCVDVANGVVDTIKKYRSCPGMNPQEVDQVLGLIRSIIAEASPATRREAARRYRERIEAHNAPNYGAQRESAANACRANIGVQCMGQCAGNNQCYFSCNSANAWRCNQ